MSWRASKSRGQMRRISLMSHAPPAIMLHSYAPRRSRSIGQNWRQRAIALHECVGGRVCCPPLRTMAITDSIHASGANASRLPFRTSYGPCEAAWRASLFAVVANHPDGVQLAFGESRDRHEVPIQMNRWHIVLYIGAITVSCVFHPE